MYGTLDISTSGMIAQRIRLEVAAANLANKDALLDASNSYNPYRRRQVHFAAGDPSAKTPEGRAMGVHVAQIQINEDSLRWKRDPGHPFAIKGGPHDGYVQVPDIDPITERINEMEALRAYEANIVAAESTKQMMAQALRLLA
jgi:flagellar basal-body rod protein FlgC